MSDLISKSELIETLKECLDDCDIQNSLEFFGIYDLINEQPAVFDVEKVVEQLEKVKISYFLTIANTGDKRNDDIYEQVGNVLDKSIEIVKAGGIE